MVFGFTLGNIAVEEGVGQGKAPFAMNGAAAIHGHIAIKHAAGDGQNARTFNGNRTAGTVGWGKGLRWLTERFVAGKVAQGDIENARRRDGAAVALGCVIHHGDADQIDDRVAAVAQNGAAKAGGVAVLQRQVHQRQLAAFL